MRRLLVLLALALAGAPAFAVTSTGGASVTRPANTTAYAAGQAICASTTVDCSPLAINKSTHGLIQSVQLIKSTTASANATFTVMIYQIAPTMTGIKDASAYSPSLADITGGKFVASASCASPSLTNSNNLLYQCTLANPTGTAAYVTDNSSTLYAMIQANAAYAPGSGETFYVSLMLLQD